MTLKFVTLGFWRLQHDPTFESFRKRKARGNEDILGEDELDHPVREQVVPDFPQDPDEQ